MRLRISEIPHPTPNSDDKKRSLMRFNSSEDAICHVYMRMGRAFCYENPLPFTKDAKLGDDFIYGIKTENNQYKLCTTLAESL